MLTSISWSCVRCKSNRAGWRILDVPLAPKKLGEQGRGHHPELSIFPTMKSPRWEASGFTSRFCNQIQGQKCVLGNDSKCRCGLILRDLRSDRFAIEKWNECTSAPSQTDIFSRLLSLREPSVLSAVGIYRISLGSLTGYPSGGNASFGYCLLSNLGMGGFSEWTGSSNIQKVPPSPKDHNINFLGVSKSCYCRRTLNEWM
jgi:hypothetical protein